MPKSRTRKKQKDKRLPFTAAHYAVALKWKTAHTAVKNTLGDKFDLTMVKTRELIQNRVYLHKETILTAVTELQKHTEENDMKAILFAAAYELYLEK